MCLRGSAAGAACTASKHAVVGLTKNSAAMYGAKGLRFNALGALTQANIPAPATAAQLAAPTTFLLGGDDTNVSGAIRASDGGEAPPSCALLHCSRGPELYSEAKGRIAWQTQGRRISGWRECHQPRWT